MCSLFHRKTRPGSLSDEEAERRMERMIKFILHDAQDKAAEIEAQAEQDAQRIYQQRLAEVERQLRAEYEEKRRETEAMYRRRQGQRLVAAELEVLRMRWEKVARIKLSVRERLDALCQPSSPAYVTFLAYLLAESLLRVADEDCVQLRCRKKDAAVMSSAREQGAHIAATVLASKAGVEKSWRVEQADSEWLSPTIAMDVQHAEDSQHNKQETQQQPTDSLGGILLLADNGRIRVNNTVEQRLTRALHGLLSVVRARLWGDDKGFVHRLVEQRRGKRKPGKRKRVVRWEKHEAHIIAVEEEDKAEDEGKVKEQGKVKQARAEERGGRKEGGREEKEAQERWWRKHEPEMKLSLPTWSGSERNTREEQLTDTKASTDPAQTQIERKSS